MKLSKENIFNDSQIQNLINQNDYAVAADYLFNSQLNSWELMKRNYTALKSSQTKSFWFDGFKFNVQFNPERIKSTSASVDKDSIASRDCFLCSENLPKEQKGTIIEKNFFLLCNPYPIFNQHFTIAALEHKPQKISEHFSEFLELSMLLSPKYSLVYNGPCCGASAPDHLHFQAGTKNIMPIENDIQQLKNDFGMLIQESEFITISIIDDGLRKIVFIESPDQSLIENSFYTIFKVYKNISESEHEPMMNLLCNYDKEFGWNLIIFPRSKHRPDCFYKNDVDKLLVSPAAVDLGGLVITPRQEDFIRINNEILTKIMNQVSLDQKTFALMEEKLKSIFY